MGFNVIDLVRLQPSGLEHGSKQRLLRKTVGNRQPAAGSILIDGGPTEKSDNSVTRLERIAKAFKGDYTTSFGSYETIRPLIEGLAPPVRRQHAPF